MPNRPEFQITYPKAAKGALNKGVLRTVRANKRAEAEERNTHTVPDKRRAFWRERGFNRQSHAASVIKGVVVLTNEQAKIHKQRSEDWPMVRDLDPAQELLTEIFADQGNRAESTL
jgi:hypothetical protein